MAKIQGWARPHFGGRRIEKYLSRANGGGAATIFDFRDSGQVRGRPGVRGKIEGLVGTCQTLIGHGLELVGRGLFAREDGSNGTFERAYG